MTNIVRDYPPNIDKIRKVFPIKDNTVFTYGDTIYAPHITFTLSNDLIVHEETHTRQQGDDPEGWWDRYMEDHEFRFQQELEAYRAQYRAYCKVVKDRNRCFNFLVVIAKDLSSPLYGGVCDFFTATRLIKN